MRKRRAADLFCGAGGTSIGAVMSGEVEMVFAVNHWETAIQTHSANHPGAKHVCAKLDSVSPSECDAIEILFASPSCTRHSRAFTGKTNEQERADAWDVMRWLEFHRPQELVVENVPEFKNWGPIGRDGRPLASKQGCFFDAWLMAIRAAGYQVDYRELIAADFGAHTSRRRLFIRGRKGNRMPVWPENTHSRTAAEMPGMRLQRWRACEEVIHRASGKPISGRSTPVAETTMGRIEDGRKRIGERFLVTYYGNGAAVSLKDPLPTITTRDRFGLVDGDTLRMLSNEELAAAQGFPADYVFKGTKAQITKQIGNSVPPVFSKEICLAMVG